MRLFIAIPLPEEIKDYLEMIETRCIASLRDCAMAINHNFHLTLKFLGEADFPKCKEIMTGLEKIEARGETPKLGVCTIGGIGFFENRGLIKVIWAGLKIPREIFDLQKRIEEEMVKIGFEKDNKPFTPHLTLARIKDYQDRKLGEVFKKIKIEPKEFKAGKFCLMESELGGEKAIHRVVAEYGIGVRH